MGYAIAVVMWRTHVPPTTCTESMYSRITDRQHTSPPPAPRFASHTSDCNTVRTCPYLFEITVDGALCGGLEVTRPKLRGRAFLGRRLQHRVELPGRSKVGFAGLIAAHTAFFRTSLRVGVAQRTRPPDRNLGGWTYTRLVRFCPSLCL